MGYKLASGEDKLDKKENHLGRHPGQGTRVRKISHSKAGWDLLWLRYTHMPLNRIIDRLATFYPTPLPSTCMFMGVDKLGLTPCLWL
jgi:hypothetical protein